VLVWWISNGLMNVLDMFAAARNFCFRRTATLVEIDASVEAMARALNGMAKKKRKKKKNENCPYLKLS
jgi:hypothetical protein